MKKSELLLLIAISILLIVVSIVTYLIDDDLTVVVMLPLGFILILCFLFLINRKHITLLRNLVYQDLYTYRSVEALFYLNKFFEYDKTLPPFRGSAISTESALKLIDTIKETKPKIVLEMGSGTSTLITALALKQNGDGKIISLEHLKRFVEYNNKPIEQHGVLDYAEILYAPLRKYTLAEGEWEWYDYEYKLEDKIDIMTVDGPPGFLQDLSRFPALDLMYEHLSDQAVIFIDDTKRDDERKMIEMWLKKYPEFSYEFHDTEDGTVILRRNAKK